MTPASVPNHIAHLTNLRCHSVYAALCTQSEMVSGRPFLVIHAKKLTWATNDQNPIGLTGLRHDTLPASPRPVSVWMGGGATETETCKVVSKCRGLSCVHHSAIGQSLQRSHRKKISLRGNFSQNPCGSRLCAENYGVRTHGKSFAFIWGKSAPSEPIARGPPATTSRPPTFWQFSSSANLGHTYSITSRAAQCRNGARANWKTGDRPISSGPQCVRFHRNEANCQRRVSARAAHGSGSQKGNLRGAGGSMIIMPVQDC